MREPVAGPASPVTPSPCVGGSPGGQTADLSRPPPQIPEHELLRPVGHGAYGQVWLARNVMRTLRAVKVVYRQDFADPQPFEREFRGIQKFEPVSRSHDGLIDILQIGRTETEDYFYYVMELADDSNAECKVQNAESNREKRGDGKPATETPTSSTLDSSLCTLGSYTPHTLRQDLRSRGHLPFGQCLQLGLSLSSALEHLHRHGLVHRDIKPSNIIFVGGQPKSSKSCPEGDRTRNS